MSLALTHTLDLFRAVTKEGPETAYCYRMFPVLNTTMDEDTVVDETTYPHCSESDFHMLHIKFNSAVLRIGLSILMLLLTWNNEPLLKSWNVTYAICPILSSILTLLICREDYAGRELYGLVALLFMALGSNLKGPRSGKMMPENGIWDGMYNVILFFYIVAGSYLVVDHLRPFSIEEHVIKGGGDDDDSGFTSGGRSLWIMMALVDYSMFVTVCIFAFFFFDEMRRRTLLFFLGIMFLINSFYQLPMEKDYWIAAPQRQTIVMGLFVLSIFGAFLPSFDQFDMKR